MQYRNRPKGEMRSQRPTVKGRLPDEQGNAMCMDVHAVKVVWCFNNRVKVAESSPHTTHHPTDNPQREPFLLEDGSERNNPGHG